MMMVTADAELAKLRMESYITPMMQQSGLIDLIQSTDEMNTRKSGKTDKKIEWRGGGFLIPFGAQNANKLRSLSIRFLLKDEPDGWPDTVGADGDPSELANARTEAYEQIRKILNLSTPLIAGSSRIEKMFELGDQRYYFVPCKKCARSAQALIDWIIPHTDIQRACGNSQPGTKLYRRESHRFCLKSYCEKLDMRPDLWASHPAHPSL